MRRITVCVSTHSNTGSTPHQSYSRGVGGNRFEDLRGNDKHPKNMFVSTANKHKHTVE
jgi:hypothetical protein